MNLSRVYVPSPTGDGYLGIPYADLRRPPISLGELERVRAALAEGDESQPSEDTIFATVREQRAPSAAVPCLEVTPVRSRASSFGGPWPVHKNEPRRTPGLLRIS
jgi:hypothetical protein